jgi:hypothetical protein
MRPRTPKERGKTMNNNAMLAKMGFNIDTEGNNVGFHGFSHEAIKEASDKYFDKNHWKNAFEAEVPFADLGVVFAACEFYLADTPVVTPGKNGHVVVTSKGYQA